MSASAIRLIACAGALATGLLLAGAGAGVSVADPGDPTSGGNEGATAAGTDANPDGGSAGSEAKPDNEPPATTFGSGRDDNDVKPSPKDEEKKPEPTRRDLAEVQKLAVHTHPSDADARGSHCDGLA